MTAGRTARAVLLVALIAALSGCGARMPALFGGGQRAEAPAERAPAQERRRAGAEGETIWSLFTNANAPNTEINVNRYIWVAALEVLDFLPVETVDPFSGVFTTGFGTPPAGGRPYRATVHVTDAALDARSLNVALITRAGPASPDTVRAVENAILNRARQIRIRDRGL